VRPPGFDDLIVGRWGARFQGRSMPCSAGRGGRSRDKREGDGASPIGIWHLAGARWRADRAAKPCSVVAFEPSGPRDRWSDDPRDPLYNQAISSTFWPYSHERMRRGDRLYDIVVMTDHNTNPAMPGAGSAIFLHCWRRPRYPTAGCVALDRENLRWVLRRWTRRSRLVIGE
jgi:L,D-peptidoglycan transpeptidase YkuD (ErfK/YbiS/YcfS/YnhG family)